MGDSRGPDIVQWICKGHMRAFPVLRLCIMQLPTQSSELQFEYLGYRRIIAVSVRGSHPEILSCIVRYLGDMAPSILAGFAYRPLMTIILRHLRPLLRYQ